MREKQFTIVPQQTCAHIIGRQHEGIWVLLSLSVGEMLLS